MKAQEATKRKILRLCQERKISINHLATLSGIPPSTLKNIINGNSNNTGITTIHKICNGLDISIQNFFMDVLFLELEQEID